MGQISSLDENKFWNFVSGEPAAFWPEDECPAYLIPGNAPIGEIYYGQMQEMRISPNVPFPVSVNGIGNTPNEKPLNVKTVKSICSINHKSIKFKREDKGNWSIQFLYVTNCSFQLNVYFFTRMTLPSMQSIKFEQPMQFSVTVPCHDNTANKSQHFDSAKYGILYNHVTLLNNLRQYHRRGGIFHNQVFHFILSIQSFDDNSSADHSGIASPHSPKSLFSNFGKVKPLSKPKRVDIVQPVSPNTYGNSRVMRRPQPLPSNQINSFAQANLYYLAVRNLQSAPSNDPLPTQLESQTVVQNEENMKIVSKFVAQEIYCIQIVHSSFVQWRETVINRHKESNTNNANSGIENNRHGKVVAVQQTPNRDGKVEMLSPPHTTGNNTASNTNNDNNHGNNAPHGSPDMFTNYTLQSDHDRLYDRKASLTSANAKNDHPLLDCEIQHHYYQLLGQNMKIYEEYSVYGLPKKDIITDIAIDTKPLNEGNNVVNEEKEHEIIPTKSESSNGNVARILFPEVSHDDTAVETEIMHSNSTVYALKSGVTSHSVNGISGDSEGDVKVEDIEDNDTLDDIGNDNVASGVEMRNVMKRKPQRVSIAESVSSNEDSTHLNNNTDTANGNASSTNNNGDDGNSDAMPPSLTNPNATAANNTTPNAMPNEDDDIHTCIVCLTNRRSIILYPCRHHFTCLECSMMLYNNHNKCPVCRKVCNMMINLEPDFNTNTNTTAPNNGNTDADSNANVNAGDGAVPSSSGEIENIQSILDRHAEFLGLV